MKKVNEKEKFVDLPFDERMLDGVLNPDNYMFLSFYPSPMCCEVANDLKKRKHHNQRRNFKTMQTSHI